MSSSSSSSSSSCGSSSRSVNPALYRCLDYGSVASAIVWRGGRGLHRSKIPIQNLASNTPGTILRAAPESLTSFCLRSEIVFFDSRNIRLSDGPITSPKLMKLPTGERPGATGRPAAVGLPGVLRGPAPAGDEILRSSSGDGAQQRAVPHRQRQSHPTSLRDEPVSSNGGAGAGGCGGGVSGGWCWRGGGSSGWGGAGGIVVVWVMVLAGGWGGAGRAWEESSY